MPTMPRVLLYARKIASRTREALERKARSSTCSPGGS
jgi:hypothetical protein